MENTYSQWNDREHISTPDYCTCGLSIGYCDNRCIKKEEEEEPKTTKIDPDIITDKKY